MKEKPELKIEPGAYISETPGRGMLADTGT